MTWITPFDACRSVLPTTAPFTVTALSLRPRVNFLAGDGLHLVPVVHLAHRGRGEVSREHVEEEDPLQLLLVLQQGVNLALGQLGERRIGGGEHGVRACALERVREVGLANAAASVLNVPAAAAVSMMSLVMGSPRALLPCGREPGFRGAKQVGPLAAWNWLGHRTLLAGGEGSVADGRASLGTP